MVNALVIGDTQNALVAQTDLAFAMAAGLDSDGDGVADNIDRRSKGTDTESKVGASA